MPRRADPAVLFLASAGVFSAATKAYWVVLAVRVVDDLALEPYQLALLGTALEVSILVGEIPTGVIADVVSRRLSIILSFLVMGPAMALAGIFEPFWAIAITQTFWGIGFTLQSGADVAWVTDELGDPSLVEGLLVRRARVKMIATIVGVAAAFILAVLTTRSIAIVVASLSLAVWGLVLAVVMPERGFQRSSEPAGAEFRRVLRLGGRLTMRTPALRTLMVVMILGGLGSEVLDRLDVARMIEVGIPDGLDEVALVAGLALAEALAGIALVRLIESRAVAVSAARPLALLLGGTAVAVAIAAGVGALGVVVVALVAHDTFRAVAELFVTVLANAHNESDARATILSFIGQAHAAGEIIGGVALGTLASLTSLSTAFVVAAALFGSAALVATRAGPRSASPPSPTVPPSPSVL